jgi:hypothetical protein
MSLIDEHPLFNAVFFSDAAFLPYLCCLNGTNETHCKLPGSCTLQESLVVQSMSEWICYTVSNANDGRDFHRWRRRSIMTSAQVMDEAV